MKPLTSLVALTALFAVSVFAPGSTAPAFAASTLARPDDPVVLTGVNVSSLTGIAPGDLVAFRYDGGWQQIPVQVDERDTKYYEDIYQNSQPWPGTPITGISDLVYVDSGTFTGPDSDPTLDANDEIAFMAKDAGGAPPSFSEPAGVIANTGVEIRITDPLNGSQTGYVYLFRQDGSLSPGAGQQYVNYTFDLLSGPYLTTYNKLDGPNPEDSLVTTPLYSHHFSDRWISDEVRITAGGATGVDILDRHKSLFAPGYCVRSEDTFSDAEGAFVVNKSGPVRAIRSYIGANSGPLTQREHVFYERRQDIRTSLRVHLIPGIMDFFDYSPAAAGMTYYDDLNTSGVTVDGNPDSVALGAVHWEMVSGAQGSLFMASLLSTDIAPLTYTSYYLDDSTPPVTQCTGDAYAYGSSGQWVNQMLACTDPAQGCTNYLRSTRIMYYEAPGLTVAGAQALNDQANTPLTFTLRRWRLDSDGDGCADAQELALGLNPTAWHDFYDVPVPAYPDPTPNGPRNGAISLGDVGAVLFYTGASPTGVCGDNPNGMGVDYDCDKDGDTIADGVDYDRSPSPPPNPPWDAGPPNSAISLADVGAVLAQSGLDCSELP
jgi:hypothetical protein